VISRPFWIERIRQEWKRAPIVWLSGVRRVEKTTLAKSIPAARYLNCDLPSVAELLEDPESFYASVKEGIVVFDEMHQLRDPSRLLKIGADAFRHLKILAAGSSSLSATKKFRDSTRRGCWRSGTTTGAGGPWQLPATSERPTPGNPTGWRFSLWASATCAPWSGDGRSGARETPMCPRWALCAKT